jgi:hypothetical protein
MLPAPPSAGLADTPGTPWPIPLLASFQLVESNCYNLPLIVFLSCVYFDQAYNGFAETNAVRTRQN